MSGIKLRPALNVSFMLSCGIVGDENKIRPGDADFIKTTLICMIVFIEGLERNMLKRAISKIGFIHKLTRNIDPDQSLQACYLL